MIAVQSFAELKDHLTASERAFLLLYKGGSDQSDCALNRLGNIDPTTGQSILTADVNKVKDIHERYEIDSAPSLLVFKEGRAVNIIKGCQTKSTYDSLIAGRDIGTSSEGDSKKQKQVTVYTTPTCSWCTTLKTYLDQQNVKYREVNVATDTAAAETMLKKSGQQGVPQTEINGQMIVGFNKPMINQLLEIQ